MSGNIKDQCKEDSHYYCWSAVNLDDRTMNLEDRIIRLNDLIAQFSKEKVYLIGKYGNSRETTINPALWRNYKVGIIL